MWNFTVESGRTILIYSHYVIGQLQYSHSEEDGDGVTVIEFTVTDGRDNVLPQQNMEIIIEGKHQSPG